MDITWQDVYGLQEVLRLQSTAEVEGENTIESDSPAAVRVLACPAWIRNLAAEESGGVLAVTGMADITPVFMAEDGELYSRSIHSAFRHSMPLEEGETGLRYTCQAGGVRAEVSVTEGRHLRAMVCAELQICGYDAQPTAYIAGLTGEDIFCSTASCEGAVWLPSACASASLREDAELPAGLPSAARVLTAEFVPAVEDAFREGDTILLRGHVRADVVYATTTEAVPVQRAEFMLPWEMGVPSGNEHEERYFPFVEVTDSYIVCRDDASGAGRVFSMEMTVRACVDRYRTELYSLLTDAYSLHHMLDLTCVQAAVPGLPCAVREQTMVSVSASLPDGAAQPARIVETWVQPSVDAVEIGERQMHMEGELHAWILYVPIGGDGLAAAEVTAPFDANIPVESSSAGDIVRVDVACSQSAAMISVQDGLHIRACLETSGTVFRMGTCAAVSNADTGDAYPWQTDAAVTMIMPQPGDTPWNLAKRNRIAPNVLYACNDGLREGEPVGKECILIVR